MKNVENMAAKDGKESLAAQSAIKILRIVAFLDNANIPEVLFKNAAENYRKRDPEEGNSDLPLSVRFLDHQTFFLSKEGIWDKLKFLASIQVLISLSFIEAHSQLYSLHLLVQSWIRNRIPKEEKAVSITKQEHCYHVQ